MPDTLKRFLRIVSRVVGSITTPAEYINAKPETTESIINLKIFFFLLIT